VAYIGFSFLLLVLKFLHFAFFYVSRRLRGIKTKRNMGIPYIVYCKTGRMDADLIDQSQSDSSAAAYLGRVLGLEFGFIFIYSFAFVLGSEDRLVGNNC
jgi:hypothetical protein